MAFSGMINLKSGLLTLGGQFDAYKRGQLERNIHINGINYLVSEIAVTLNKSSIKSAQLKCFTAP